MACCACFGLDSLDTLLPLLPPQVFAHILHALSHYRNLVLKRQFLADEETVISIGNFVSGQQSDQVAASLRGRAGAAPELEEFGNRLAAIVAGDGGWQYQPPPPGAPAALEFSHLQEQMTWLDQWYQQHAMRVHEEYQRQEGQGACLGLPPSRARTRRSSACRSFPSSRYMQEVHAKCQSTITGLTQLYQGNRAVLHQRLDQLQQQIASARQQQDEDPQQQRRLGAVPVSYPPPPAMLGHVPGILPPAAAAGPAAGKATSDRPAASLMPPPAQQQQPMPARAEVANGEVPGALAPACAEPALAPLLPEPQPQQQAGDAAAEEEPEVAEQQQQQASPPSGPPPPAASAELSELKRPNFTLRFPGFTLKVGRLAIASPPPRSLPNEETRMRRLAPSTGMRAGTSPRRRRGPWRLCGHWTMVTSSRLRNRPSRPWNPSASP